MGLKNYRGFPGAGAAKGWKGFVHISKVRHPHHIPHILFFSTSTSLVHLEHFQWHRYLSPTLVMFSLQKRSMNLTKSLTCGFPQPNLMSFPKPHEEPWRAFKWEFRASCSIFLFHWELRSRVAILDKCGAGPTSIPSCKSPWAVEVDGSCLRPQAEGTQQTTMSF